MFELLLKLLVLPPELLKVHAQGYADLASHAWAQHLCTLKNRWVLYSLGALNLLLALILELVHLASMQYGRFRTMALRQSSLLALQISSAEILLKVDCSP